MVAPAALCVGVRFTGQPALLACGRSVDVDAVHIGRAPEQAAEILPTVTPQLTPCQDNRGTPPNQTDEPSMRGADTFTESLFTMRHLDDFVPADHPCA
jgi:hypothetical protein